MPICAVSEVDAKLFTDWTWAQHQMNAFDSQTLTYPRSCMAKVSRGDETVVMVPFHPVLMFESLCHLPSLGDSAKALSLSRIDEAAASAMKDAGLYEAYFLTSEKRFADLALTHGWTIALFDADKSTWLMKKKICESQT